jgi:hypothetical protein
MEVFKLFDSTKDDFEKLQKNGKCYNYPKSLRQSAVKLLDYYPAQTLSRHLGVSSKSLSNWQEDMNPKLSAPADFISLDVVQEVAECSSLSEEISKHAATSVTLHLPHDMRLIMSEYSPVNIAEIICALIKRIK